MGEPLVWYYVKNSEVFGPMSHDMLQHMLDRNELDSKTLVWSETLNEWMPVENTKYFDIKTVIVPPPLPRELVMKTAAVTNEHDLNKAGFHQIEGNNESNKLSEIRRKGRRRRHRKKASVKQLENKYKVSLIILSIIVLAMALYIKELNDIKIVSGKENQRTTNIIENQLTIEEITKRNDESMVMVEIIENGKVVGSGSGFIYNNLIITNCHVIGLAKEARVVFCDGTKASVEGVMNHSLKNDLAVMRIKSSGELRSVALGDSDEVRIGEAVVAISSPKGLKNTVSNGIISGFRQIEDKRVLQTSASIAPGSSGGALFNMRGEVIGVTSSQVSGWDIYFAIPINDLKPLLEKVGFMTLRELRLYLLRYDDVIEKEVERLKGIFGKVSDKYKNSAGIIDVDIQFDSLERIITADILVDGEKDKDALREPLMIIGSYLTEEYEEYKVVVNFYSIKRYDKLPDDMPDIMKSMYKYNPQIKKWEYRDEIYWGSNKAGRFKASDD